MKAGDEVQDVLLQSASNWLDEAKKGNCLTFSNNNCFQYRSVLASNCFHNTNAAGWFIIGVTIQHGLVLMRLKLYSVQDLPSTSFSQSTKGSGVAQEGLVWINSQRQNGHMT